MKRNRRFQLLSVIGFASFFMLTACDSDKSASEVKDAAENVSKELESKVGEVAVAAVEKTEEVATEVNEKIEEVVAAVTENAEEKSAEVTNDTSAADTSTTETEKSEPAVAADTAAEGAEHIVKMLNNGKDGVMVFEPAFLKVEKGATVKFIPTDVAHDSVSVLVPEGAASWTGENSKEVTVTLDVEGVYVYKCTPHAMMGMVGVIQVGEATNKADAEKAAETLVATMAMGKERLGKYLAEVK